MGVPVLTDRRKLDGEPLLAAVLSGVGEQGWICRDASELGKVALKLSLDTNKLRERRLKQRDKVAASALPRSCEPASSLATSFREWWRHWLEKQRWPLKMNRKLGPGGTTKKSTCRDG